MKIIFYLIFILFLNLTSLGFFSNNKNYVDDLGQKSKILSIFNNQNQDADNLWIAAKNLYKEEKFKKSEKKFKSLYKNFPNSKYALDSIILHAKSLEAREKWIEAFNVYQYGIDNFSNKIKNYNEILEAQYMVAKNEMNKKRMTYIFGGYNSPELAIPLFEIIIKNRPSWDGIPQILMMIGNCYKDIKKYEEAIVSYKKLYHQFSSNALCKDAMYQHIVCLKKLSVKYPISNEIQKRLLTTTTLYLSKFSSSEEIKDIINLRNKIYENQAKNIFEQGQFYERIPKDEYAAILTYKNMIESFPLSQLVSNAQFRIEYLEGKKLKSSTIINSEF